MLKKEVMYITYRISTKEKKCWKFAVKMFLFVCIVPFDSHGNFHVYNFQRAKCFMQQPDDQSLP